MNGTACSLFHVLLGADCGNKLSRLGIWCLISNLGHTDPSMLSFNKRMRWLNFGAYGPCFALGPLAWLQGFGGPSNGLENLNKALSLRSDGERFKTENVLDSALNKRLGWTQDPVQIFMIFDQASNSVLGA